MIDGTEIRLYDPGRPPAHRTDIIARTQRALLLSLIFPMFLGLGCIIAAVRASHV